MPRREEAAAQSRRPPSGPSELTPLGRLTRYSVSGLFGSRNIEFELDKTSPTLLTGVNGTGKSTILRTIDAISTARWPQLFDLPFRSLTLTFASGEQFTARQEESKIIFELTGEPAWTWPPSVTEVQAIMGRIDTVRTGLTWSSLSGGRDRFALEDLQDLLSAVAHDEPGREARISRQWRNYLMHLGPSWPDIAPPWVQQFPKRFPVLFITDQRLVIEPRSKEASRSEAKPTNVAAEEAARNIAAEIGAAQARYANRSQTLDRTSPRRVIAAMKSDSTVDADELRSRLVELSDRRQSLQRSALLTQEATEEFDDLDLNTANIRAFVATYVSDMEEKLKVLEPLRRRLALFTEFLSQHYRNKTITVDPQSGFTIRVGPNDEPLPPARLSSGEQQILVLAHHILFRALPGTLVLIDEPELSLHVVWQATLVEDLTEMGRERELAFLLATHSPTLLAGREDLKRSLDEDL